MKAYTHMVMMVIMNATWSLKIIMIFSKMMVCPTYLV